MCMLIMLRCYLLEFHFVERRARKKGKIKRERLQREKRIDGKKFPNVGIFNKFSVLLPPYFSLSLSLDIL